MDSFAVIKNFMADNGLNYLLVNSTNEFLVEYNTLEENSRYKLTKFSGSTGEALVTPDTVYLFVDGRYHIQADNEVSHEIVTVVKMDNSQNYQDEAINRIPESETLGVFAKKISQKNYEYFSSKRNVKLLNFDPLDIEIPADASDADVVIPVALTGLSTEEKIRLVTKDFKDDECLYLTDLDEVSYLYNKRNFLQNYSAKIKARAVISKDRNTLYKVSGLSELEKFLKATDKKVFIDKTSINAYDYSLLGEKAVSMAENPVKLMKSRKTPAELEHLKSAFERTDRAVSAVREYIENSENISEYDISRRLEEEFKKQGALGLSFKSIVAKDKNSALAHYSKSSKNEIIKDGSLVLIDCGGYFEGGLATDITRVFVKGMPSVLQKKIYTLVLRAFLNAYNYGKTHADRPFTGFDVDAVVQKFFKDNDTEGFVFNHGLGHGIGVNVHEYPPKLSTHEISKVEIKDGMVFSIEPGLYKQGEFGVRLENSCYYKDGQIHSLVKMNYEKKLIDFSVLTGQEKIWLDEFEVK